MSESTSYDVIKMRVVIYLNALYMILFNERFYRSEYLLYDIIKMRDVLCLNDLYMILLKWEKVFI